MEFSLGTMVFMVINFLLLVAILWYVLYRPVGSFLRTREQRIAKEIDTARLDRAEAERLRKEYEARMVQLKRDVHDAIEKAHRQGEQERREIVAKAREEASAMIQRAIKQIEDERNKAWDDLKSDVVEVAMLAASKVLGRSVNDDDQRRMFEQLIESIHPEEIGDSHEAH